MGQKVFIFLVWGWTPLLMVTTGESATVQAAETEGSSCGPGAVLGGGHWCEDLTNPLLPPARAGPSLEVETRQQLSSLHHSEHRQILSPVNTNSNRTSIRGDDAKVSLVLLAILLIWLRVYQYILNGSLKMPIYTFPMLLRISRSQFLYKYC